MVMIEFKGRLSQKTEKHYLKRNSEQGQNLFLIALLLFLPAMLIWGVKLKMWPIIGSYVSMFILVPLLARIPPSKKEKEMIMPTRIVIDDDCMYCYSKKCQEARYVEDVSIVRDFGDFYELRFPFGKVSNRFICQKDLITKGTLEDFETLFEGKIKRM